MGVLDSIGNGIQGFRDDWHYHPFQSVISTLAGAAAPGGGQLSQYGFHQYNTANGTSPDQLRAAEFADEHGADINAAHQLPGQQADGGPTTQQMDQHLMNGYNPTDSTAPWYNNTTIGAGDQMGLVPDYTGNGPDSGEGQHRLSDYHESGELSHGTPSDFGGNSVDHTQASGNQLPGGGYTDVMNGASDQMRSGFGPSDSGGRAVKKRDVGD